MDSAGQVSETADLIARPSIASHKGGLVPIWAAGAVTSSWNDPSSSGQLPVPVALNAGLPTLLGLMIHENRQDVNRKWKKMEILSEEGNSIVAGATFFGSSHCQTDYNVL